MNTVSHTDRLRRLLLMLSSPYDGEIVAAAKAISCILKKNGTDWHGLGDRLIAPPQQALDPAPKPGADWDGLDAWQIAEALLKAGVGRLSEWEASFLNDMTCWDGPASDRQDAVLRRIANKLGWRP